MFETTFKNIDDILHKDAGCSSELDYTEQTSWMLFLKYLDDLEQDKKINAELMFEEYEYIIDEKHRWSSWAAPKVNGKFDYDNALTGDDLMDYVDTELFPYLKGFKQRAESPHTIEYKIGEIFGEIKNKIQSGYAMRDCLEKLMSFASALKKKSTSCHTSMKLRSRIWEMRVAMVVNITHLAH
ncbi:type I restriction-modification system [Vibrio ishigakensis]|uniref:Type I restriction-modification system n=1 Tax=Vibrio ishigakensis TaxID=1481914 RepID=A0A0B8PPG3_9VIBR|nr:type I restriction-modification system [Vibrio ishigakensis]